MVEAKVSGVNPGALNDEQLMEKITQCRSYLQHLEPESPSHHSVSLVLAGLEAEMDERRVASKSSELKAGVVLEFGKIQGED